MLFPVSLFRFNFPCVGVDPFALYSFIFASFVVFSHVFSTFSLISSQVPRFPRRYRDLFVGTEISSQVSRFPRRYRDLFAGTEISSFLYGLLPLGLAFYSLMLHFYAFFSSFFFFFKNQLLNRTVPP